MKIVKLKNGIEKKMPFNFNVKGVGVCYNDTTYKGISGTTDGDVFDLKLGEDYLITQTPLTMLDRIGKGDKGPLGFKFSYPVIFKKGEKLEFACRNASIDEDDIYLLLYGLPIPSVESLQNKIQRKPNRLIKLHTFQFPTDGASASQEMGFDKTINIMSIGLIYAEKLTGITGKRYIDMPDSILGYFEVVGHLYYIFEDKTRPLNLISDMYLGYRSETKWYNCKKIKIPENDLLTLKLSDALTSGVGDGSNHLWTLIEYYDEFKR